MTKMKVSSGKAYLLCSNCGGFLWLKNTLAIDVRPRETRKEIENRLRRGWGECNGNSGNIICTKCGGK